MSIALTLQHYVDGERLAATPRFDSINPSNTADIVARVPDDDGAATEAAVAAAVKAYPQWSEASRATARANRARRRSSSTR